MAKPQDLFEKKYLEFTDHFYSEGDKEIATMAEEQNKNKENFLIEIAKIILIYEVVETVMKLTGSQYKKEYSRLDKLISSIFKGEYESENTGIGDILKVVGNDKYNSSTYLNLLGSGAKRKRLSTDMLKEIINSTIDGKNYSDRLWTNKNKVAQTLQKEIKKFMQGKTSVNDIQGVIQKAFNANEFNTRRLVTTEIAKVQTKVGEKWAKDNGVEWQMFTAVLDSVTSEICRGYDGKTFKIDDPNKPTPPLHPNCRSTLVPITKTGYRPNITEDDINFEAYKEWENNTL